ncbi:hypothetical protein [Aequorivita marina]|uniref:hypothetical protein n=1 Tax=Aequorivita marina TaxID=3073654 RepID=UPI00287662A1|nr:hypothetical protein [Aequorivita sp. S2608]MDS1297860.1 hypothetical protein [Aequorivita sp. S2608]
MKETFLMTALCMFLFLGCTKENDTGITEQPKEYNLYLDISKPDGSSYSEGEVEARSGYINVDGEIEYYGEWNIFKVDRLISDQMGKNYFGPYYIGGSIIEGNNPEPGTESVYNQILLLRYNGTQETDTLRTRDSILYPEYRYFDIFKNDNFIQRFEITESSDNDPWLISLIK